MSSLPEELYFDILSRLPVISILTCKCVCRSWFQLICDPRFVKSHLNIALETNDPSHIFTFIKVEKYDKIFSISYHSLKSSSSIADFYENCVSLDYPFKPERYIPRLLGSCNGLVCIQLASNSYLWNPATTEYKRIPASPEKMIIIHKTFGYDHMADDYMLVNVRQEFDRLSMDVYTLRLNLWKSIETFNYILYGGGYGEILNGKFHVYAITGDQQFSNLLYLDLSNQKFIELQLPIEASEKDLTCKNLGVLEGCLSLVIPETWIRWEVWAMRDYGVRESWTKLHIITHSTIVNEHYLRVVWSFKNGDEILLMTGNSLVLYDKISGELKRLANDVFHIYNYVESLVSLNTGDYVKKKIEVKKQLLV